MAATKMGLFLKNVTYVEKCPLKNTCMKYEPNRMRNEARINYFHFSSKNHKNAHQSHNFQPIILNFNRGDGLGLWKVPAKFGFNT